MKIELSSDERRHLKALAHPLNPVVMIGNNGLTDAVMREIAINLDAHELIKIRVYNDDREERDRYLHEICNQLEAAPVQHIGKLLVVWRPAPEETSLAKTRPAPRRRAEPRKTKRSHQG